MCINKLSKLSKLTNKLNKLSKLINKSNKLNKFITKLIINLLLAYYKPGIRIGMIAASSSQALG